MFQGFAAFDKTAVLKPYEYKPRPLGDFDIEIEIKCCGICHSDIHTIDSGWGECGYPCIPGHEIVGIVAQKGSKVTQHKVGDRVGVGAMVWACLDCGLCKRGLDNCCAKRVFTYNSAYADGGVAQGGYAKHVRVQQDWAFAIPDSISNEQAAPLLCAGITVFAPIKRLTKPGNKVGVAGIGGLGHLAIQYAAKMGFHVTAISTSPSKKEEAKKLGATDFLVTKDKEQLKQALGSFDIIFNTASGGNDAVNTYIDLLAPTGTLCLIGLPEDELTLNSMRIVGNQKAIVGSIIGSIQEMKEMFAFSAAHSVLPWISVMPMEKCNEGVEMVRKNQARYRIVLKN